MSPDAAMIFAAGFGTRMGALTRSTPKPLIQVAGRALLDHALDIAAPAANRLVVNTHYLGDQIAAHLAGRDVALSHEAPEILDTGGGLRKALPLLGAGPVMTLNSDAVWTGPNPLRALQEAWDSVRMDALLMLIPREAAVGYTRQGDFLIDSEGRLSRGPGLVFSGAQIIRTEGLAGVPEQAFSLNLLWNEMLPKGRVFGIVHRGGWCDVGHPDGIAAAEAMLARETPDV